ncbi:alpha amylase catalytic subunit [Bradyrhizobium stylosanthis]|uniref:Alpha amylase catalytic subunit n=1 Tax=Bradyrhizobium stylosanthis TaxID=1803665 RepID=A0A560E2I1_9BRAD|nr:alpha amylase catalytic subunit [Bradyrhizobium stylosanthis]
MNVDSHDEGEWWRSAVIYEIALISFQDSNGDGKGDLAGLIARIDYLKWLGVDAVWLTPIYKSPFRDLGYDISDYRVIDPAFGCLDQFDELLKALHAEGIRLILDLVPNHTANDHKWFVESSSSPHRAKADWVHLGRCRRERRAAQQLDEPLWRQRLGMVRSAEAILLSLLPGRAARLELA